MPATDWNSFARVNASTRWRAQSAAMGRAATDAIVEEADVQSGMRVLDVASGTGEPAISIAANLAGTGGVVATDLSPGPLNVARERARQRGLRNISFAPADVHNLPFADGSFDRVTSRLGVMFFSDLARALREIHRVMKPGGRVSLLAWGPMRQPYFETTIGTIRRLVPDIPAPDSAARMFRFSVPNSLTDALTAAGFRQAAQKLTNIAWSWPGTPEEVWEYFQEVTVPFKPLLEAIPPERRAEISAEVLAAIRRYYDGCEVKFTADFVLASATR